MTLETSRRDFLKGSAVAGATLIVGLSSAGQLMAAGAKDLVPNPFVRIKSDGTIVVICKHFETGQGTATGLSTLIAEELDADWENVTCEMAPSDPGKYQNLLYYAQGTGGSTSIANSFHQYREAGATAKELLIKAAAKTWKVSEKEIKTEKGVLSHKSGKKAKYGEMVALAAKMKPSGNPPVKDPKNFKLIGNKDVSRQDSDAKTDGTAMYAMDMKVPNMVYAVIARSPLFGGKAKSVDDKATRKVKGVVDVKSTPAGVVVYAKNTWAAMKGREALKVVWDNSKAEKRSSAEMLTEYKAALKKKGHVARNDGNFDKAHKNAKKTVSAEFQFPFLAHSPMEPLNCVVKFDGKSAEIWDGCQFPSLVMPAVGAVLGISQDKVKINTLYAGGSFGRRANGGSDYTVEAAHAVKAIKGKYAVKLVWTREDDVHGGWYRPAFVEKIDAGLDKDGKPVSWRHRLAGKSVYTGTPYQAFLVRNGVDQASVEGGSTLPYAIPNLTVDVHNMKTPVPVSWWRAVGHTHTAYASEVVIDMLAEQAGVDPVEFRRKLLANSPRDLAVLNLAAKEAGWGKKLPKNHAMGVAVHPSFKSHVAQVVEVSKNADGAIKLERVVCAIDCGVAVNPDVIKAQMEGGIGYGLGAAMRNKISFDKGMVEQSNFPDYEPLRISEMPKIDVHIVASSEDPTGVGEPGLPPVAPALANAIFGVLGKRAMTLPMTDSGITFA